jgi:hypothetical protein
VKRKPWTWCIGCGPTQGLGPPWTKVPGLAAQDTGLAGDVHASSSWHRGPPRGDQEGEESSGTSFWCSLDGGRR